MPHASGRRFLGAVQDANRATPPPRAGRCRSQRRRSARSGVGAARRASRPPRPTSCARVPRVRRRTGPRPVCRLQIALEFVELIAVDGQVGAARRCARQRAGPQQRPQDEQQGRRGEQPGNGQKPDHAAGGPGSARSRACARACSSSVSCGCATAWRRRRRYQPNPKSPGRAARTGLPKAERWWI